MTGMRWGLLGLAAAAVAAFPLVYTNQYVLTVIVTTMIVLVLNTSWNFVLGMAGAWNFGQLAIYAIGGYGAGILMLHTPLPAWLAVLGGGVFAMLVSVLLAFPTLRLYGIYTSLLTFAFAEIVSLVILNDGSGLTGGPYGFPTVPGLFPSLSGLASLRAYYWTVLGAIVLSTAAVALIKYSQLGIVLRAVRDAPSYAAARGVSPLRYRVAAFAISGFIAGIAGALYLSYNTSITPSVMGLTPLSIYVTMLVIGGLGTIFGPLLGTTLVAIIQTELVSYPGIQLTILGAILLIIVIFVPGGLVGLISRTARRIGAWVREDEEPAREAEAPAPPTAAEARASDPHPGT